MSRSRHKKMGSICRFCDGRLYHTRMRFHAGSGWIIRETSRDYEEV